MKHKKFCFQKIKNNFVEKKLHPFKKLKCIKWTSKHSINNELLKNCNHFFVYDPLKKLPTNYFDNVCGNNKIVNLDSLKLINELKGCYGASDNGVPPFILIPRNQSLNSGPIEILHQVKSLLKLVHGIAQTKRGTSKKAVYSHYVTLGAHANRGAHGISYKKVKEKLDRDFHVVVKMVQKAEHCANNVLPSAVIDALKRTKDLFEWSSIETVKNKGNDKCNLWASIATSYNYASAAHIDKDFFLSMLTVTTEEHTKNKQYVYDQSVALYFVFPELGLAIALRPGDQLIFNPLYYHCVSTKDFAVYKRPVHITSFYLKTAIVGGNDNQRELEAKLFH